MRRVALFFSFCGFLALTAPAVAQGYQGLIADDPASVPKTAPKTAPRAVPGPGQQNQPPGYQGLIPGALPPSQAPATRAETPPAAGGKTSPQQQQQQRPATATPPMSPIAPDRGPATAIRGSEDLRRLAAMHSVDKSFRDIPPDLAARFRLPETATEMLKQPRQRIDGLLPMEYRIKNGIEGTLTVLRSPNLTPAARESQRRVALESLQSMHNGLRAQSGISDSAYQAMGLPPQYVQEEREAIRNSLTRVEAAIRQLQR